MSGHECGTPPTALPGAEWTCPTCGVSYFASDDDGPDCTFEWVAQ